MKLGKQTYRRIKLGVIGLIVTALLFGYLELTNYAPMPPILRGLAILACPPSLLSLLFFDAEPHTASIAIVWLFIGLVNAGLYAFIGEVVRRRREKPIQQT